MKASLRGFRYVAVVVPILSGGVSADELGTAFAYRGQIKESAVRIDGVCDFEFRLWDAVRGGEGVGPALTFDGGRGHAAPLQVAGGRFTAVLDFGSDAFDGRRQWLQISYACPSGGEWTTDDALHAIAGPSRSRAAGLGAGNTLDQAYDEGGAGAGRTITADAGPVNIDGPDGLTVNGEIVTNSGWIGTKSTTPVRFHVNNVEAMRIEYAEATGPAPNIIMGSPNNNATPGVAGATIIGGGDDSAPNTVNADFGTITGGWGNQVFGLQGTVGGGRENTAAGEYSTVGGGQQNTGDGMYSSVVGGSSNTAGGARSTVGGGMNNSAGGNHGTVAGGEGNTASGPHSTVPGGKNNEAAGAYSFAAGRRAKANHAGSFVWGGSTAADFASTANDQFLIRAGGGVGIGTNVPKNRLDVEGAAVIGASYSGTNTAPSNGLLVQGNVGIGTSTPGEKLTVAGIVDSTTGGFRFPDNSLQAKAAFGDGHSLDASDGSPTNRVNVDAAGLVGIGNFFNTTPAAESLEVRGFSDITFSSPIALAKHVVVVNNARTSGFNQNGAAVLGLKAAWSQNPGSNVNFVTFYGRADEAIGAIEGSGSNGVVYKSGSADFAEYLPKMDATDSFEPGEVVGVMGGRISKSLNGANYAMVVSNAPIVLGNVPQPEELGKFVTIAMLGQISVKVSGRVQRGDYIVADPNQKGVALAIAPDQLAPAATRWIIGRAWGSSNDTGVKLIRTAVGITGAHVAQMAEELAEQRRRIDDLQSHESRLTRLEAQMGGGCEWSRSTND